MWLPPVWLARGVERLRGALAKVHRGTALPPVAVLEMAMGAWLSQALWAAARLGVADALAAGPRTPEELATELVVDAEALDRLLRALCAHGIFQARGARYALNARAQCLRSNVPESVRDYLLFLGHPRRRASWSQLDRVVRAGRAHDDFFAELTRDRELGEVFDAGMTALSKLGSLALAGYDFARFDVIVDVGGGRGANLVSMLGPHAHGVLFDLPEVVAGVQLPRVRVEGGSFFERVPQGGDAYVLKHILHDWGDERASTILRNVRRAIPAHGKLVLIESVVPATPHLSQLIDLEMLTIDGKERTEAQWRSLLARCGFRLARIVPTAGPVSVLEADTSGA